MNVVNLSDFTSPSGVCVLYMIPSGTVFIQDNGLGIKRLKINRSSGIKFIGTVSVKGYSDIDNIVNNSGVTNQPLISIQSSPRVSFDRVEVEGLVETSKPRAEWTRRVPNGIYIRSRHVHIVELISKNIHHSLIITAQYCMIDSMTTETFSGDDGQITASNITIGSSITKNSIQMFTYDQCHRDVKQIHTGNDQNKILSNIRINSQYYRDGNEQYSKSPDGVIIHSDGIINNCEFLNVDAETDTPENGVSSVCSRSCYIKIKKLQSLNHSNLGVYIQKKNPPKPQVDSYENIVVAPSNTLVTLDQPTAPELIENKTVSLPATYIID